MELGAPPHGVQSGAQAERLEGGGGDEELSLASLDHVDVGVGEGSAAQTGANCRGVREQQLPLAVRPPDGGAAEAEEVVSGGVRERGLRLQEGQQAGPLVPPRSSHPRDQLLVRLPLQLHQLAVHDRHHVRLVSEVRRGARESGEWFGKWFGGRGIS